MSLPGRPHSFSAKAASYEAMTGTITMTPLMAGSIAVVPEMAGDIENVPEMDGDITIFPTD